MIVHFSDTHLGKIQYNLIEREEDIYNTFDEVINKIIEVRPNVVLHTGDMFDLVKPPSKAIRKAAEGFIKLKEKGIKIYSITGDHDTQRRRGEESPQHLLNSLGIIRVLGFNGEYTFEKEVINFDGKEYEIYGVRHHPLIASQKLKETLSIIRRNKGKRSILMLHQGIREFLPYQGSYQMELLDLPNDFLYYALGHIHSRYVEEVEGKVIGIAGSIELISTRELESYYKNGKGAFLIDLSKGDISKEDVQKIDVSIRPQLVEEVNLNKLEEFIINIKEKLIKSNKKPILHLKLYGEKGRKADALRKMEKELGDIMLYMRIDEDNTYYPNLRPLNPSKLSVDQLIDESIKEVLEEKGINEEEKRFLISVIHEMLNVVQDDKKLKEVIKRLEN